LYAAYAVFLGVGEKQGRLCAGSIVLGIDNSPAMRYNMDIVLQENA